MNSPIENIRLSQTARDQLIKLKRYTGIKNWNVLCRWGFCASIAEPSPPPAAKIPADGSVEMDWQTFGGVHQELYLALLRQRCKRDGLPLDDETLASQFKLHLHRGIAYLAADRRIKDIAALVERAVGSVA